MIGYEVEWSGDAELPSLTLPHYVQQSVLQNALQQTLHLRQPEEYIHINVSMYLLVTNVYIYKIFTVIRHYE